MFRKLCIPLIVITIVPATASGQEPEPAVVIEDVWRHEGELRFSVEATGLFDEEAQRTIRQGGTAAIEYTIELYRRRAGWFDTIVNAPLVVPFRVSYDAFERKYRLLGADIRLKTDNFNDIVAQCTKLDSVSMGSMEDMRMDMNATYYLVARVSYQPLTVDTIDELRDWVSRPGSRPPDQEGAENRSTGVGSRLARALMSAAGYGEEELQGESRRFKPADLEER